MSVERRAAILETNYLMSSASITCHLATGVNKHNKNPPAEFYSEISSVSESVDQKPKKPNPLNLYLGSIKELLKSRRPPLSEDQIVKIYSNHYKALPEEIKIQWIIQALDKEPLYKVF